MISRNFGLTPSFPEGGESEVETWLRKCLATFFTIR